MSKQHYFHRVNALTPSKFWINNPTREEAVRAIEEGATGCTLNPSYSQKMIDNPTESEYAYGVLAEIRKEYSDPYEITQEFQRRLAKPICEIFLPLFEKSNGNEGFVSIQANPLVESAEFIINEGRKNRSVSPNVCCKVPVIKCGLEAITILSSEGTAINATEIFAIDQCVALNEAYIKGTSAIAMKPKLFYSHIAGIYDEFIKGYVAENQIKIPNDYLVQAGLSVSRKMYDIVKERGYNMSFIGGGARAPYHFTELIGGDVNLTINWIGTADKLLTENPPVISRIFNPVEEMVVKTLADNVPAYKIGYYEGSLSVSDFEDFGPVLLFNSSFVKSWNKVLSVL